MPAVSGILQWRRLLGAALAAGIFSCAQGGPAPADLRSDEVTGKVRIFCIALEDNGASGRQIGCNDSVVPVEVTLTRRSPALEGALQALLDVDEQFEPTSGLYNSLYASPLKIQRVVRQGSQVQVVLDGYLELGGTCDSPRVLAQLQETALQFEDVQHVYFYLDGKPLTELLSGKG
jgi:hypothetical protein